jgi:uncharacterized protein (DUF433 family)
MRLIADVGEAKSNIDRYEAELPRSTELQAIMSYARSWLAYRDRRGRWRVGPSKFVGYADNTAAAYVRSHRERDGRQTERVLGKWFQELHPGEADFDEATAAVLALVARFGRSPNKLLRVSVLREGRAAEEPARRPAAKFRARITVSPDVCSGRPTIRGTRMRVSDVLDMLASGALPREILDDYPYLEEADIAAVLEFAAESVGHRVIRAA